jgi:hypothetical protein
MSLFRVRRSTGPLLAVVKGQGAADARRWDWAAENWAHPRHWHGLSAALGLAKIAAGLVRLSHMLTSDGRWVCAAVD